ncbi:hypothetical protein [Streptomyces boluensis]|uniref:Uncharacterized protein n=1 Tax=Streptomyces boluensis TaxID=1775135 RepID=A0A964XNI6_9ACTN|nr:hypothetical protein [Streptomyces boluensis]NBE53827.1 hypothetical protein [Streptomyces boluensis]
MSEQALNAAEIPEFTGNLGQLERDVSALAGDATSIWESGTQVDTSFQGLSAYYEAPEAEQLFATTAPVSKAANEFSDDLESVAQALGTYAAEVRPLVDKLKRLKEEAAEFSTRISGDDEWHYDDELTGENQRRRAEVHVAYTAFQAAERTCANKIFALFSDFRFVQDDGKGDKPGKNEYGYSADMLDNAQGLPWGDKVDESIHWYEVHRQIKHFVWDGIIVDGVWGTLRGIGTLLGVDGGAAAGEAWTNLAKVVTGLAMTIAPAGAVLPAVAGGDATRRWLVESQNALKETGKAMISYDQWGKDNSRAAGGALFNIGTTVLTGGAGAAAKGGAIARGISAASKVAHFIDPATYLARGASFGVFKIGDAMATLRNVNSGTYLDLANGSYKLGDEPVQAADLPANSALSPENSVKGVDANGNTIYLNTETGLIHRADGSVMEKPENVIAEASAQERGAEQQPAAQPERDLAGVGGRSSTTTTPSHGSGAGHSAPSGPDVPGGRGGSLDRSGGSGSGGGWDDAGRAGDDASVGRSGDEAASAGDDGVHAADDAASSAQQTDGPAQGGGAAAERELPPAERKRIQDEHVRKANSDPTWFKKHYEIRGGHVYRQNKNAIVDGSSLPILKMGSNGELIAKYDMPSGPAEVRFNPTPLGRNTVPDGNLPPLDEATKNRKAALELTNAQRAFKDSGSAKDLAALTEAKKAYAEQLGSRPNNSKISEELGEKAAELHVVARLYPEAKVIDLPKTPNGANMFDGAYRMPDGEILITECKAPSADLDWRQGKADPEDPAHPDRGDDGGAQGMRVKQGTLPYVRTIFAEMTSRGGDDAVLAAEFREALKQGKLRYVLVKANASTDGNYAGAILENLKMK